MMMIDKLRIAHISISIRLFDIVISLIVCEHCLFSRFNCVRIDHVDDLLLLCLFSHRSCLINDRVSYSFRPFISNCLSIIISHILHHQYDYHEDNNNVYLILMHLLSTNCSRFILQWTMTSPTTVSVRSNDIDNVSTTSSQHDGSTTTICDRRSSITTDWPSIYLASFIAFAGAVQFSIYFSSLWPYLLLVGQFCILYASSTYELSRWIMMRTNAFSVISYRYIVSVNAYRRRCSASSVIVCDKRKCHYYLVWFACLLAISSILVSNCYHRIDDTLC